MALDGFRVGGAGRRQRGFLVIAGYARGSARTTCLVIIGRDKMEDFAVTLRKWNVCQYNSLKFVLQHLSRATLYHTGCLWKVFQVVDRDEELSGRIEWPGKVKVPV